MSEREDICMVEIKATGERPFPLRWSAMDWRTPHENKLVTFQIHDVRFGAANSQR